MSEEGSNKRKWVFPVVAGTFLLVLTLLALFREPVVLDRDTPEGTVQVFLQAIADNDFATARDQLSTGLQEECSTADIAGAGPYETFTATLGDVEEFGDETLVDVSLRLGNGSRLDSYTFDPGPYRLQRESGRWGITKVPWPYFFFECGL
ncbi:MAG: hypothetical protein WDZ96_00455 [Acidimicrobiia bacterium]